MGYVGLNGSVCLMGYDGLNGWGIFDGVCWTERLVCWMGYVRQHLDCVGPGKLDWMVCVCWTEWLGYAGQGTICWMRYDQLNDLCMLDWMVEEGCSIWFQYSKYHLNNCLEKIYPVIIFISTNTPTFSLHLLDSLRTLKINNIIENYKHNKKWISLPLLIFYS